MAKIFNHNLQRQDLDNGLEFASDDTQNRENSTKVKHSLLPVERFDHRNGLKSLQIHETITSLDGRIWCATPSGLACYDGVNIYMFDRKHGLGSHGLRTLAIHPDNTLWIGTDVGIDVLDITGLIPGVIWSEKIGTVNALQIGKSKAAIGTSQGLFFWDGKRSVGRARDARVARSTITSLLLMPNDDFWIAGPSIGIVVLNSADVQHSDLEILNHIGRPTRLEHGQSNQVIIGGNQGLVCANADGSYIASLQMSDRVGALLHHDGFIWVGSGNSLLRLTQGDEGLSVHDNVLENVDARHLMGDQFDNIWISTGDQALLRLSGMRKTFTDKIDGDIGAVMCVKRQEDQFYIGGSNGLIGRDKALSLVGISTWDVLEDNFGKVWVATNDGLYCKVNPHFTIPYRHAECDVVAAACRVLASYNGKIYVGSIRGLAVVIADGVQEVLDPDGKSLGYVYSLHVGPEGRLWIATLGRGIFRIDKDGISGVALNSMPEHSNGYAFAHDQTGFLYLAHDNKISKIDDKDGELVLVDADVAIAAWALKFIEPALLIAGTSNGLIIYDSDTGDIRHKISGNFDDVPWEFTTSRSLEISKGGQIHCGLGSGLRNVNLDDFVQMSQLPSASYAYSHWRGAEPTELNGKTHISAGRWHLEIGLKTCWYLDDCTMRTRLLGFEDEWGPIKAVGPVSFTSLPRGEYALEVEITSHMAGSGPVTTPYHFSVG